MVARIMNGIPIRRIIHRWYAAIIWCYIIGRSIISRLIEYRTIVIPS
jgi:hypothetical protein